MVRGKAGHHPRIAEEVAIDSLDRPPRNAVLHVRRAIAVKLLIALDLINRTALVGHHVRIGMHLSKRSAMLVMPRAQPQSLRLDH